MTLDKSVSIINSCQVRELKMTFLILPMNQSVTDCPYLCPVLSQLSQQNYPYRRTWRIDAHSCHCTSGGGDSNVILYRLHRCIGGVLIKKYHTTDHYQNYKRICRDILLINADKGFYPWKTLKIQLYIHLNLSF